MKQFIKQLKEQEQQIKAQLDHITNNDDLEQLKSKYKLAKNDFNNYGGQDQEVLTKYKKWGELETIYLYFYDKTKQKALEQIELEIKKALEQIEKADNLITYLLCEHLTRYDEDKQQTRQTANKITNIYLLLKGLLEG